MPVLYNCRHSGDQYRITKFDDAMNVESSYLTDGDACDCPAGQRPTCRHRQMLPKFIAREHIGDEWFFDFDRGGWVQMGNEWIDSVIDEPQPKDDAEGLQKPVDEPAPLQPQADPSSEPMPIELAEVIMPMAEIVFVDVAPEPAPQRPTSVYIRRRL